MDVDPRQPYETPDLIAHGTFESLTQAGAFAGGLDANYPEGTPNNPPGIFS